MSDKNILMGYAKADDPVTQAKTESTRGCVVAFLVVVFSFLLICSMVFWVTSPSDWVDVTVGPLPGGYRTFCLIAEDANGIGTLPWYHAKVFPFTEDPFMGGILGGGFWDHDNDGFIVASVQWREAKRYGVLIHRRDEQWRLWWLDQADLRRPSVTRFVFGDGEAVMHLPAEDLARAPSKQLLQQLGLADAGPP